MASAIMLDVVQDNDPHSPPESDQDTAALTLCPRSPTAHAGIKASTPSHQERAAGTSPPDSAAARRALSVAMTPTRAVAPDNIHATPVANWGRSQGVAGNSATNTINQAGRSPTRPSDQWACGSSGLRTLHKRSDPAQLMRRPSAPTTSDTTTEPIPRQCTVARTR